MSTVDDNASQKVILTVDQCPRGIQIQIGVEDENGCGHGYRIAGPKYLGDSTAIKRVVLARRDADEIRQYLDLIDACPTCGHRREVWDPPVGPEWGAGKWIPCPSCATTDTPETDR